MRIKNRLLIFTILISLLLSTAVASADEFIDKDAIGSISISLNSEDGGEITGGKISIIKIADIDFENNCYRYVDDLKECDADLNQFEDSEFPGKVNSYLKNNQIKGEEILIINGKVNINDLELGIYLIKQITPCDGYLPFNTFVISIPNKHLGVYEYDVDANPKMDALEKDTKTPENPPEATITVTPSNSPSPTPTATEKVTDKPTNPKTGDNSNILLWSIITLLSGLALAITFVRESDENKK